MTNLDSVLKSRETRDKIANIHWVLGKAREFQKNVYFCFIDYTKAFDRVDHNCGKFLQRWEYQTSLPASWETCTQVKRQQVDLDRKQQPASKLGKDVYKKAVYCYYAYLNYAEHITQNAGLDE